MRTVRAGAVLCPCEFGALCAPVNLGPLCPLVIGAALRRQHSLFSPRRPISVATCSQNVLVRAAQLVRSSRIRRGPTTCPLPTAAGRCCYGHSHAAIVNGKTCELWWAHEWGWMMAGCWSLGFARAAARTTVDEAVRAAGYMKEPAATMDATAIEHDAAAC